MKLSLLSYLPLLASVVSSANASNKHPHHSLRGLEDEGMVCPADVSECPDGSFVPRDPLNNCAFEPCPGDEVKEDQEDGGGMACATDVSECPDGSFVSRDPLNNCEFDPCPSDGDEVKEDQEDEGMVCAMDVSECPDGSFVPRDPLNNCEFEPCPSEGDEVKEDQACAGCEVLGICHAVGEEYTAADGCNTCTCGNEDGEAVCTLMACPPCDTCEMDGMNYCAGQAFLAPDGCNTCRCSDTGGVGCTKMFCVDEDAAATDASAKGGSVKEDQGCAGCEAFGICYAVGEQFTAEDGCNTCTCGNEDGEATCTAMACPPCDTCDVNGKMYCAGQTFLAPDGCNTCRCSDTGGVVCTKMACPEEPDAPATKEDQGCAGCEALGICYAVGEQYTAEDGCNSCTCGNESGEAVCTIMACPPCDTCDDNGKMYCAGQTYLSSDGCNTCTCNENGTSGCTMMACPEEPDAAPEIATMSGEADPTSSAAASCFSVGVATSLFIASVYFASAL